MSINDRPILKIKPSITDRIVELLGIIGLIALIALPFYYFNELPETIAMHFNHRGNPDSFSSKNGIWILPIIGTLLFAGLWILKSKPHLFNYPIKITTENASNIYHQASSMLNTMSVIIVLAFLYIEYTTINVALSKSDGLGLWFLPVFLGAILGSIILSLTKMNKAY